MRFLVLGLVACALILPSCLRPASTEMADAGALCLGCGGSATLTSWMHGAEKPTPRIARKIEAALRNVEGLDPAANIYRVLLIPALYPPDELMGATVELRLEPADPDGLLVQLGWLPGVREFYVIEETISPAYDGILLDHGIDAGTAKRILAATSQVVDAYSSISGFSDLSAFIAIEQADLRYRAVQITDAHAHGLNVAERHLDAKYLVRTVHPEDNTNHQCILLGEERGAYSVFGVYKFWVIY